MRWSVDPWDPSYGIANEAELLEPTSSDVNAAIEVEPEQWQPRPGAGAAASSVLFVDGVRRIEARVWLDDGSGAARPGICASYAAGATRCDGSARVGEVIVERGIFTASGEVEDLETQVGRFRACLATAEGLESLSLALQERMGRAEVAVAEASWAAGPAQLLVIDGPLRGRQHLPGAVGYVKTHHVAYLPPALHAVVGRLEPGQRSPLFLLGTSWSRISWYFRLPAPAAIPWAGVVRGECSSDLPVAGAAALADLATLTLQLYASEPHKEPRAPQNLYPIAGLERELRRRLGDQPFVYRALRKAAASSVSLPA